MGILYEKRDRFETSQELDKAWQNFRDDDNLWIAVVTGAGDKLFCSGADLNWKPIIASVN